jgi:hypothetical protein
MTPMPPPSPAPNSDDAVPACHPRVTVPVSRIVVLLMNGPLLAIFLVIWATQPAGQIVPGVQSPSTATSGQSRPSLLKAVSHRQLRPKQLAGMAATPWPLHVRQPQQQRLPRRPLPPLLSPSRRLPTRPDRATARWLVARRHDNETLCLMSTCATPGPESACRIPR